MTIRNITADLVFTPERKLIPSLVIRLEEHQILEITSRENIHPDELEIFQGILCPGFINCHTHLELSHLMGKIPEKIGLDNFLHSLVGQRKAGGEEIVDSMKRAENEMIVQGIVAVGDISNSDISYSLKENQHIYYHTFIELFGFDPGKAEENFKRGLNLYDTLPDKNKSMTIHAPYSVSLPLIEKIMEHAHRNHSLLSVHNQESEGENNFFLKGEGPVRERFKKWDLPVHNFTPTGKNSLPSVLPFFPKENKILLVHNTYTKEEDIDLAMSAHKGLFWCFCPKANLYIENRLPDINMFRKKKAKICLGTDSLASNDCLSIMEEMKVIQKSFLLVTLGELLTWAICNGAEFLGIQNDKGSFEKGKIPGINLIRNLDIELGKLREDSWVQVVDRPLADI